MEYRLSPCFSVLFRFNTEQFDQCLLFENLNIDIVIFSRLLTKPMRLCQMTI